MANIEVVFESHLGELLDALPEQIEAALTAIGMAAETHAKEIITENGSVDTGRLRNSITHDVDMGEQAVLIGSNVEYAPYIELGHSQTPGRYVPALGKRLVRSFIPGKPFLRPAVERYSKEYRDLVEAALKS